MKKNFRVYCLIGDGESQEGQIWEAANIAEKYKLDNLIVIMDQNGLQQYGWKNGTKRMKPESNGRRKFDSFGFETWEVDGNCMEDLVSVLTEVKSRENGRPKAIIANTTKGKGVRFMENNYVWHSKAPNDEEYVTALMELEEEI